MNYLSVSGFDVLYHKLHLNTCTFSSQIQSWREPGSTIDFDATFNDMSVNLMPSVISFMDNNSNMAVFRNVKVVEDYGDTSILGRKFTIVCENPMNHKEARYTFLAR